MVDVVTIIARAFMAALFIGSGFGHLTQTKAMAGYAESKGVLAPRLSTQVSGVVWVVGGVAIALGILTDLAALILAAQLVVVTFTMHKFWSEEGEAKMTEQIMFNKNLAIIGGLIILSLMSSDGLSPELVDSLGFWFS